MTPQAQRQFFDAHGYLVIEDLLSPPQLDDCRREIHRLHELAAQLERSGDPRIEHFQREPFADGADRDDGLPVLRKVEQTYDHSPLFADLAKHPPLIEVVQLLLGDDLLQFRSTLMLKPAHHGSIHAMHQDSAYWPMKPPRLVTVSIALTDATPDNGCFQVIPKSHEWGLQDWGDIATQQGGDLTGRDDIDLSAAIDVPLKAGSALLFHSLLVHGSGANRTANPRNTALYAYFSPHVQYVPRDNDPPRMTFRVIAGMQGAARHTLHATNT